MNLFITGDSYWEAGIDKVLDALYKTGYTQFFEGRDYGSSLHSIAIVLMCQNPDLNLKRRIRFARKEKTIYIDIMLDLPLFLKIDQKEREKVVVREIINEIPLILVKYKLEDFDLDKFKIDLTKWMNKIL